MKIFKKIYKCGCNEVEYHDSTDDTISTVEQKLTVFCTNCLCSNNKEIILRRYNIQIPIDDKTYVAFKNQSKKYIAVIDNKNLSMTKLKEFKRWPKGFKKNPYKILITDFISKENLPKIIGMNTLIDEAIKLSSHLDKFVFLMYI